MGKVSAIEPLRLAIERQRIVAVLRFDEPEECLRAAEAAASGGVTILEVTLTTPGALGVIERLARIGEVIVGVGSVRTTEELRGAAASGARFMASPVTDTDVVSLAGQMGLLAMPGALTPTEIERAWRAGADVVKVFPMPRDGAQYLRAILGPLPDVRLAPSGGVSPESARELLEAGAYALNVGSWLTHDRGAASAPEVIRDRAARLVSAIRGFVV